MYKALQGSLAHQLGIASIVGALATVDRAAAAYDPRRYLRVCFSTRQVPSQRHLSRFKNRTSRYAVRRRSRAAQLQKSRGPLLFVTRLFTHSKPSVDAYVSHKSNLFDVQISIPPVRARLESLRQADLSRATSPRAFEGVLLSCFDVRVTHDELEDLISLLVNQVGSCSYCQGYRRRRILCD